MQSCNNMQASLLWTTTITEAVSSFNTVKSRDMYNKILSIYLLFCIGYAILQKSN